MGMDPLLHFSSSTVNSLFRRKGVCNTMMDNDESYKFIKGSLGEGIAYRAGKFIFRICISGRNNAFHLMMEEVQIIQPATRGWGSC